MTQLPEISPADVATSLASGMRASAAHDKFSTDKVQLAFGEAEGGRIQHITRVARGRDCACHCPACSEELVAKQGDRKAWHFAHASGGSCKDALSATFAKYTAQLLNDRQLISLPELMVQWGLSSQEIRPSSKIRFEYAEAVRPEEAGPFEVRAKLHDAAGMAHQVRILFRSVKKASRPRLDALRDEGVSTLEIDLFSAMQALADEGKISLIEETWLADQVLCAAQRHWVWNAHQDRHYAQLKKQRLGAHITALARLEAIEVSADPTDDELFIEEMGLSRLLDLPSIRGERIFGPTPKAWRAMLIRDLILKPFMTGAPELMIAEVGIDRRTITRWMAHRKVLRVPQVTRPLADENDAIEFQKVARDIRKPIDVAEDYLKQLWGEDIVRAKPTKALARDNRGVFDDRLRQHGMPFWLTSDITLSHIKRTIGTSNFAKKASGDR
jgi:hypothetical protein